MINDINFKNIHKILLYCFIAIAPIFFYQGTYLGENTMRITQLQFMQIGVVVLTACLIGNLYISLFMLLTIGLYFYFGWQKNEYLMNIFTCGLIYHITYRFIDKKDIRHIVSILLWLCVANIFWMIAQTVDWDLIYRIKSTGEYSWDLVGLMGLKAILGVFLALCFPFAMTRNFWIGLLLIYPIALTECSVAIVGVGAFTMFYIWHKNRELFVVLLLVVLILGGAYVVNDSKAGMMTDRASLWKVVLRDAVKHPIAGYGLDSFRNVTKTKKFMYIKNVETGVSGKAFINKDGVLIAEPGLVKPEDRVDPWDNAHNEYIQLFYEFGIIGLIILLLCAKDIIRRFNPYDDDTFGMFGFFIVLAIVSIGQFPFHLARIAVIIPVIYACYIKTTNKS